MNLKVTQENLHLFLPGKIAGVARIYAEEHGCSINEAIKKVYSSQLYSKLAVESTKYWTYGAVALYEEMTWGKGSGT